ncbi:hypothetical protein V8F33_002758 [Rhypophila sp. PSN 637]
MSSTRRTEVDGKISSNVPAPQAPVQGGASMGGKSERESGLDFVPMTPFIYAFRLRECFLKKEAGSSKPYTKGAKMSVGEGGEVRVKGEEAKKEEEDFVV